ncbi:hypothetical protein Phum_PHUM204590 [Pediculus humanus corporis]|uniref:Uncharacterized protein n=1 Tax=Pediculus humanus subsp. corporis TaxID=121224 RepID=E0VHB3_PEDHC|nr:uncharacterized protein Phum_PHUM204590 [Pediculus humanus corporis]EEB12769.1 hypothetical protein Phum_PHUM204590 [Pediculus humanus corporis]
MDNKDDTFEEVCYVCSGIRHSNKYVLNIKPISSSNEPYFSFLETHEPPRKYKEPIFDNQVQKKIFF